MLAGEGMEVAAVDAADLAAEGERVSFWRLMQRAQVGGGLQAAGAGGH